MLERDVEAKLKELEWFGFEVFKLVTPGKTGVMDRMILWPTWSPAPPTVVETKRPGKKERPLQAARHFNWIERGVDVRGMCDTVEKVRDLCDQLLYEAVSRWRDDRPNGPNELPPHIMSAFVKACERLHIPRGL